MCYSAQIRADYGRFVRHHGATVSLKDFYRLYWLRQNDPRVKVPRALDVAFLRDPAAAELHPLIHAFDTAQATRLEQELFKQRTRLVAAERALATRPTRKAQEDQRIAGNKIDALRARLADLRRSEPTAADARIYPGHYAPVLVADGDARVLRPMRYQCRPAGKPASYDSRYPGTYNARRDNLEGFWKGQFGHTHGVLAISAFYENVSRHAAEGRALAPGEPERNVVLEFRPDPPVEMLVACLWSRWTGPDGEELLSFAAITDTPPPEVAAAGHDRCIIPIRPGHLDAWLHPDPANRAAQYAILDDRERPYYAHRMAA